MVINMYRAARQKGGEYPATGLGKKAGSREKGRERFQSEVKKLGESSSLSEKTKDSSRQQSPGT